MLKITRTNYENTLEKELCGSRLQGGKKDQTT